MTPQYIYTVLKQPPRDGSDPGAAVIEEAWFIEEHGFAVLTDSEGNPLRGDDTKCRQTQRQ